MVYSVTVRSLDSSHFEEGCFGVLQSSFKQNVTVMDNSEPINPITLAFSLLEGYSDLLGQTLADSGLSEDDVSHVITNLEDVGIDGKLYFSINRAYQLAPEPFEAFCREHLSDSLFRITYRSESEDRRITHLYEHQAAGIRYIADGRDTVIATGTGSGKTETFLFPVLDACLNDERPGVKAVIVYPMNALANDQLRRLSKLVAAASDDGYNIRFGSFTGLTPDNENDAHKKKLDIAPICEGHVRFRDDMRQNPPDILITNHVMMDRMLSRSDDSSIFAAARDTLRYVVIDEVHTYRGNSATHLRGLLRRLRFTADCRPVFVGTSATLSSGDVDPDVQVGDNFLSLMQQKEVDDFIRPLFDTNDYELVLPTYAPVKIPHRNDPIPDIDPKTDLGWSLTSDEETGLRNLSLLTGKALNGSDLGAADDKTQPKATLALQRNTFFSELNRALVKAPVTFGEAVDILRPLLRSQSLDAVQLTKSYLSAIAFVNHAAKGSPVLDFRIHLFLRELGGFLQLCIRCGKYHSGRQESCGECSWPLYTVDRRDIRQAIGKVSGRELRRRIGTASDDPPFTYLVGMRLMNPDKPVSEGENNRLRFGEPATTTPDGIHLEFDERGRLSVSLIPRDSYETPTELAIPLVSERKTHQYLHSVVSTVLRSLPRAERKLLGFIDNRERASRNVTILEDEFASHFYRGLLSLYREELAMRPLPDAVNFLIEQSDTLSQSEYEMKLVEELPIWLSRELSRTPRSGRASVRFPLFRLEPPTDGARARFAALGPLHQQIIRDVFFDERAIDKRFLCQWIPELASKESVELADDRIVKFQRYLAWRHQGIAFENNAASSVRFVSISLGPQSHVFKHLVEGNNAPMLEEAVRSLSAAANDVDAFLLSRVVEPGDADLPDKVHYYLNPRWVRLGPPEKQITEYQELQQQLLRVDLHTGDVRGDHRASAEDRFQDGQTHFMLATPTLEMGVDIGQLKHILLVGVPPLPSNYAQRAGRAGRSRKGRDALVVTLCSEDSNHDRYYFDRPREMVAGYISPPSFDPNNARVLKKHVNALLLAEAADDIIGFLALTHRLKDQLSAMAAVANQVFGDAFDTEEYVFNELPDLIQAWGDDVQSAQQNPRNLFYANGVFPDHGFRHDEVQVLDIEKVEIDHVDLHAAWKRRDWRVFEEFRVTGRFPEQAYYKLVPGKTTFMAGDALLIDSKSPFYTDIGQEDGSREVRNYRYLFGRRSDNPSRDNEFTRFETEIRIEAPENSRQKSLQEILEVRFSESCIVKLRNWGAVGRDGHHLEESVSVGYDLVRAALVFSMRRELYEESPVFVSLLSALDRSIKDNYGLDEGDLSLVIIPPIQQSTGSASVDYVQAALYDADGNNNAPMARIFEELEKAGGALQQSYDLLEACPNPRCKNGCYICLRSYSTQFHAQNVDRGIARMVTGHLLGLNPLDPSIRVPDSSTDPFVDLAFEVNLSGEKVTVQALDRQYLVETGKRRNPALYEAMSEAARQEFTQEKKNLRVVVGPGVGYFVPFLNEQRLSDKARSDEKMAFEALLFELLRYRSVEAIPIDQL
jgi:replicative superfamily II helicase